MTPAQLVWTHGRIDSTKLLTPFVILSGAVLLLSPYNFGLNVELKLGLVASLS